MGVSVHNVRHAPLSAMIIPVTTSSSFPAVASDVLPIPETPHTAAKSTGLPVTGNKHIQRLKFGLPSGQNGAPNVDLLQEHWMPYNIM